MVYKALLLIGFTKPYYKRKKRIRARGDVKNCGAGLITTSRGGEKESRANIKQRKTEMPAKDGINTFFKAVKIAWILK